MSTTPQALQDQPLDLSSGLIPKQAPPSSGLDLSAGLTPKTVGDVAGPPTHVYVPGKGILPVNDPNVPTMSAATPSLWDRIKSAVTTGIPAFNSDFEVASHTNNGQLSNGETPQMQLVTPQAAMTSAEKKAHPVVTAVAETAGGLTSPGSVATIAGTAGFGELGAAGKTILPRLISAGFSAQALKGAYDQVPEFRKALDTGNTSEAERILTHIVLDVGMGGLAARHAATGGPAISDTAENAVDVSKRIASGVSNTATTIKDATGKTIDLLSPSRIKEQLTPRGHGAKPMHGEPAATEQPLDGTTINKQLNGKNLSQEAVDALHGHVGNKIDVGSTAKTKLMEAVQPVTETIDKTAKEMNQVVRTAPKFTTSTMTDAGLGEGKLLDDIAAIKKAVPASDRPKFSADIDEVLEDADKALNSTDPTEVLEQRRILGNQIDWQDIAKNPATSADAVNAARVKVYHALGNKIHDEIPETVALDRTLQPNLELRSHMKNNAVVGQRYIDDPHSATVEAQREFEKGKDKIAVDQHNAEVTKRWGVLAPILKSTAVGAGGLAAYKGLEFLKDLL